MTYKPVMEEFVRLPMFRVIEELLGTFRFSSALRHQQVQVFQKTGWRWLTVRSKPYVKFKSVATLAPKIKFGLKIGPTEAIPGICGASVPLAEQACEQITNLPGCESDVRKRNLECAK